MQAFLIEHYKGVCYALLFLVLHLVIFYNIRRLQQWFAQLELGKTVLKPLFFKLRIKIYTLWGFLIVWMVTKFLQLWLAAKLCKACSSFVFCLILGDFLCLVCLIIFRKFIKNLSDIYPLLQKLLFFGFVLLGCVVAANNLGYSIGGLLTTLGIGGAAIAFAAQNTLSNLWGAVSILLDQPFKEGDWIRIGSKAYGRVESIGLRSTRLRTEQNTLVIIPNNILMNEYVENSFQKTCK
ncbi:MAG: mechanosensitive ion channel family protein [Opitutales bacterium]